MLGKIAIKDAKIITLDAANRIIDGSVTIEQGIITRIVPSISSRELAGFDKVIDGRGKTLLPGFVQTHIHLCQTLFRGSADDLSLIDWLQQRVWPMEAAHTFDSLYASALLGIAEMIRGGTTCALTMETVNYTEAVFQAIEESGFRATAGKCMMDYGEHLPEALSEETDYSLAESLRLLEQWHGRANGRISYCFAPRFAVSCTRDLLERVAMLSRQRGVMVHTHASENLEEIALVKRSTGKGNIEYLRDVGLTAPHVLLAHCIHLNDDELKILRESGTHVAHCPSSNLKLASGIARVDEMLELGISVSLGADGAPCNNRLDMYTEMRTAALLQKVLRGSRALPALTALRMATTYGARAMGLSDWIGSIEVGKRADLQLLDLNRLHTIPQPDIISTIVYAAEANDVETVIIDGKLVMHNRMLMTIDEKAVISQAREQAINCRRAIDERGRR
jgi:5-methylthioadenosine/S-adenosylhomocysteine deaminase